MISLIRLCCGTLVRPCDTEMWYYARIFGVAWRHVGSHIFAGFHR